MAEIPGASVDFTDYSAPGTPRVLNIPAAHGDASTQDLWDTLSAKASELDNLIYKKLIDRPKGGGKSALGGSKSTGITLPMNNVQIRFEESVTKLETGTITTADSFGEILNDSLATFQTKLVARGDLALNSADGSYATILRVVSETQVITTPLKGGSDNQWAMGDTYEVSDQVKRNVSDGDVIAQDHLEAELDPILTAFGVDATRELSTSPALVTGQPTKSKALDKFGFTMVLSSDHVTPATGLIVSAERALDGPPFVACDNAPVEMVHGFYYIDLTPDDMNGRTICLRFSAAGADQREIVIVTAV